MCIYTDSHKKLFRSIAILLCPFHAVFGTKIFQHCQLLEEGKLFQIIFKVDESTSKCLSINSIQHKKGYRSVGHSFMAISGQDWHKNGPFSAFTCLGIRKTILNDIQSG